MSFEYIAKLKYLANARSTIAGFDIRYVFISMVKIPQFNLCDNAN